MFTCVVPSPIYLPVGTTIWGRLDYSGLPDWVRSQNSFVEKDFDYCGKALSKYIGDDIQVPNAHLYKVYSVWNGALYEYSLIGIIVPTWEDQNEQLFPISIKKYAGPHNTYLYIKSIETVVNILNTSIAPRYSAMSAQSFFNTLISQCNPSDCYYMSAYKNFHPSFYDQAISEEAPQRISDILIELGQNCLNYSSSAASYLYYLLGEDLSALHEMFSHGPTDDMISAYGLDNKPLAMKDLQSRTDYGSNMFYNALAQDTILRNSSMFNLTKLDKSVKWYNTFQIDELLETLYSEPATDINAIIVASKTSYTARVLFSDVTSKLMLNGWEHIREAMNRYNNAQTESQIVQININKTWLDELFLSIAFADGNIENYFLNMALFHLYSPAIIRVPTQSNVH